MILSNKRITKPLTRLRACVTAYMYKHVYFKELVLCNSNKCYDIKPVRKEEGKSYWKIPLCDDDATREK